MGEIADFMLLSHYGIDNFDDDAISNYHRHRSHGHPKDLFFFSRRAAVCRKCGVRYENLYRSVAATARAARDDGWQINFTGSAYEWYCPKCKAAHDFESIINAGNE